MSFTGWPLVDLLIAAVIGAAVFAGFGVIFPPRRSPKGDKGDRE